MKRSNFRTTRIFTLAFAAILLVTGLTTDARSADSIFDRLFFSNEIVNAFLARPEIVVLPNSSVDNLAPLATLTWDGGSSGIGSDSNWTTNDNWAGVGGASEFDSLVFPQTALRKTNFNNFGSRTQFNGLTFTGTGYVIGFTGNGANIDLANGMTVNVTSAGTMPIFSPNMFLANNQTWTSNNGFVELDGVVNLNGNDLTLTGVGSHRFDGIVSGGGSSFITKNGSGNVIFNGDADGFGGIGVIDGTVHVGSGGTLAAVALNGGTLSGNGTVTQIGNSNSNSRIAPGSGGTTTTGILTSNGIVALNTATLEINLNGTTAGGGANGYDRLTSNGGDISLVLGHLSVSLGFTPAPNDTFTIVNTVGAGNTIIGQFVQGTGPIFADGQLFTITYSSTSVVLTAQGPLTSLTWDGGGTTNNWSEAANWNPNFVPADGMDLTFPTGAPADSLTNTNDLTGLDVRSIAINGAGYNITGSAITLSNGITANQSAGTPSLINLGITLSTQAQTFSSTAAINLNINNTLNLNGFGLTVDCTDVILLNGTISGAGGITKTGSGSLVLSSNNSYTGVTTVNNGTLRLFHTNAAGAAGAGNNTVVANGASLQLVNNVITVPEAITLNGTGVNGIGALQTTSCSTGCSISGPVTLASTSTVSVATSNTLTLNGVISGSGFGLTKIGAGTLILNATNTYSGTTTVNAGTLLVNGFNFNSPVSLTGGTLGGTGNAGTITATGGTVAPGNSPGTLTVPVGSVILTAAATLNIEIGGTTSGMQYDNLSAIGGNLIGANLTGTLINGFNPVTGDTFTIITTFTGVGGQFAQGSSIIISGRRFNITYNPTSVVLTAAAGTTAFDYDGDRKTDISVFRPSQAAWFLQRSQAGFFGMLFGFGTDKIVPADYDGDGKTDIAVFRPADKVWFVANSSNGTFSATVFGLSTDIPAPADYDGDGKADLCVFRPSDGTWYRQNSSNGSFFAFQFGTNGDKPTVGDFDGDGKSDIAVYRPSTGTWFQVRSTNGSFFGEQFGFSTDKIVPADYDGDGKTDLAVYRPSDRIWYIKNSSNSTYTAFVFGLSTDIPAPGDYDGDGKADLCVFRPSDGTWYRQNSSNGSFFAFQFGLSGDTPTPNAFN